MIDNVQFEIQKIDLISCYQDYIDIVETLRVADLKDIKKLSKLNEVHIRLISCDTEFLNFIKQDDLE